MNTQRIANHCPKCKAPLPSNAPEGLCPKCLLAAAAAPTEAGLLGAGQCAPPSRETVAAAFPQLEIIELIGCGGMGAVYKARQPRLDRYVALKILPPSLGADAGFAERFGREARVLARLNHPNIVTVYDFGQSAGLFYLLMEFIDGLNLRQAMQAARFSPRQALLLVPKICEALQFAHDEGILHRDIKPENILLDSRGRLKIADFGIAKLLGQRREGATLTGRGIVIGTPNYMAPEQIEHPGEVDQRADIYSLGVVFYEMLTGELPLGRFEPPSAKIDVDTRIDQIVLHALEKEREKRFHSAEEVKTSVEKISAKPSAEAPAREASTSRRLSACYFSTPRQLSDCFRGPLARVFQCKGELSLEGDHLLFLSPWQSRVLIPLPAITHLSLGQIEMRTVPWAAKSVQINTIVVRFAWEGAPRTVDLTPIPSQGAPLEEINRFAAEWFDAIRSRCVETTAISPKAFDPKDLSIRVQHGWNRRAIPLLVAPIAAWIVGLLNIRSPYDPVPVPSAQALALTALTVLFCLALAWYYLRLREAERALGGGEFDSVTANIPPDISGGPLQESSADIGAAGQIRKRPFWWRLSAWIFLGFGLTAVVETLAMVYRRPFHFTLYFGWAYLLTGIALMKLSGKWRAAALVALAVVGIVGTLHEFATVIFPEAAIPVLSDVGMTISVPEEPYFAALATIFRVLLFAWPCYLLLSAKARAQFRNHLTA